MKIVRVYFHSMALAATNPNSTRWRRLPVFLPLQLVRIDPAVVIGVVQAGRGRFVENDGGSRMQLQRGSGADGGQGAFDHVFDGTDFRRAKREQQAAAGVKNGADAHRDGML